VRLSAPRFAPGFDPENAPSGGAGVGVLLANLGTPDTPEPVAIRRYLREFLSDPRVIERPAPWLWQLVLRGAILPRRPKKLALRYQHIWLDQGAPLLVYSQAQADGLAKGLRAQGVHAQVALGMRYGNPALVQALDTLLAQGCEHILVLPLYPQYAASTTATVVDAVTAHVATLRNQPELRFVKRYHTDPAYTNALIQHIRAFWNIHGVPERLLLSFHGLPCSAVAQGDPYYRDCMETAQCLREGLGEDGTRVHVAFQSRFGRQAWLQPYIKPTLQQWAREGVASVDVLCPSFLADCLETLEEIQIDCRAAYLDAGGTQFRTIPCLNDDPAWLDGLVAIVRQHLQGWV